MPRAADDFDAIRARAAELRYERNADRLPAEWLTPEAIERKACDGDFTADEIATIASILGHPKLTGPLACALNCVEGGNLEMVNGPDGWVVSAYGHSLGPFRQIEHALKAVPVLRRIGEFHR